jgi:hypothetical protein
MRKSLTVLATASTFALAAVPTPITADARKNWGSAVDGVYVYPYYGYRHGYRYRPHYGYGYPAYYRYFTGGRTNTITTTAFRR